MSFYFILSSEISAYQKQIKVISITSEMICFHCSIFWITFEFSVYVLHFNSELKTPITFLFVNVIFLCEYVFSLLERDEYF